MGRHSAPEDDGDLLVAPPVETDRPRARPRHAAPDDDELLYADVIEPELVDPVVGGPPRDVVDAVVVEDERFPVRIEKAPAPPTPTKERPGRADLRLLRENSSLRARCTAAVLLPFILYTIVLVVIGRVDVYLYWIWIPAIAAGVLFGAQLDAAHKARAPTE